MPPLDRIDAVQVYEPGPGPLTKSAKSAPNHGYWRHLEELGPGGTERAPGDEWPEAGEPPSLTRRRVLQLLAASMSLAGAAACSRQPPEFLVPYVERPENQLTGVPRYYASAAPVAGYAHGILVQSYQGRPCKVEGNPDHPATLGACDAIAQALVLSLYDPDRSGAVYRLGEPAPVEKLRSELSARRQQWDASGGAGVAFLTGAVTSPSQAERLQALLQRWPQARWYVHEPVDRRALHHATEAVFDQPLEPIYHFDRCECVLALDADFMNSQPGFLRYSRDLIARRRPRDKPQPFARLYAVESGPTLVGAVADHRQVMNYLEIEAATRQLAAALGLPVAPPVLTPLPAQWLEALVTDLRRAGPRALVVAGEQQSVAVQMLAQAINIELGAPASTVDYISPVAEGGEAGDLAALLGAIEGGQVRQLLVMECDPLYSGAADLDVERAFTGLEWSLHFGQYRDQTGRGARWHVPACHPLESWADIRAFDGTISLQQPLLEPLYGGLSALQMLALVDGSEASDARDLLRRSWHQWWEIHRGAASDDFDTFWQRSLRDGLVADTASQPQPVGVVANWQRRLPKAVDVPEAPLLQLRPDPALWDGRYANNAWLQEMPRPLTTLTWDNALLISSGLAKLRGLGDGELVELETEWGRQRLPVYILPGQPDSGLTLHLGHGQQGLGRVAEGVGSNAYRLVSHRQRWATPLRRLSGTGERRRLPAIQYQHNIQGRDLVRAASLEEYRDDPHFAHRPEPLGEVSLYPEPEPGREPAPRREGAAWAMSIDLSACIGCNACVTACQAENNIPVVGPEEVARGHDMHWLRVDRYFSGDPALPELVFQPVPCMHCENAPCEYVCPVGATQHSSDGLNEMIYQRCIGTRYCSQNCPYKVRRFNWFDYNAAERPLAPPPARQNPEVTVRSRGVMEKCTYCVQRINNGRQQADAEQRPLREGDIQTACQQACPTQAIVFGDRNAPGSEVARLKENPLDYTLLSHVNARPRTSYLAAVRNPNSHIAPPPQGAYAGQNKYAGQKSERLKP